MRRTAAVAGLALLAATAAGADEPAATGAKRHFEAWLGGSWTEPGLDTAYQTRYSPTFDFGRPAETTAGQSLTIHGDGTLGGEIGLGWSPDGRWDFRLTTSRASSGLSGVNTPYSWSAQYVALPPPSNEPQTIEVQQSLDWPDTEGELRVTTLALGVSRRWEGPRFGGGLSAGGALLRSSGEVRRLGFTALHLGGHSTLFTQEFEVEAAFDPETSAGFHLGGDVDVALAPSWRLRLGYRYLHASRTVTPRVTRVVNADEILLDEPLSQIAAELALPPLDLDLSSSRLLLSLVLRR
jgi:opacity protein-like surface antigen